MALVNEHFLKLANNYLFADIAKKVNAYKITHPWSAMTCTAAEIGGERLAGRNHAENSCALCGGQQNDRPAPAASHKEGAGRYGESQEKSPTPARLS